MCIFHENFCLYRVTMLLLKICILFMLVYGSDCNGYFLEPPQDTLAVIGDNVTMSCTLNVIACGPRPANGYPDYLLHWQHQALLNSNPTVLSYCMSTNPAKVDERFTVSSLHSDWALHIQNVQHRDAGRYRCNVYSYVANETGHYYSSFGQLTVVDQINTAVKPPLRIKKEGGRTLFHCEAFLQADESYMYTWFISTKGLWKKIQTLSMVFWLTGNSIIISSLRMEHNGIRVACEVFRGNTSLTRQRQTALLILHPKKTPITTEPSPAAVDSDSGGPNPSDSTSNNNLALVGGCVSAVVLLFIMAFLLYWIFFKDRQKPNTNPQTSPDSGLCTSVMGSAETQLDLGPVTTSSVDPGNLAKSQETWAIVEMRQDQQLKNKHAYSNVVGILPNFTTKSGKCSHVYDVPRQLADDSLENNRKSKQQRNVQVEGLVYANLYPRRGDLWVTNQEKEETMCIQKLQRVELAK